MSSNIPPAPPAPAYLYTPRWCEFDYGPWHPLRVWRLRLVHELIGLCGLGQPSHPFEPATMDELAIFHDKRYLQTLRELSRSGAGAGMGLFGLGDGDNPVFKGMYEWAALLAGASLAAARLVVERGHAVAFNMAGGMHHAMAARASGFCYVNDPVVVAKALVARGLRVAYVDMDVHHGDGVQWAFYDTDQVLTISLHQHPATLFPGTGYLEEIGKGKGEGYSVNIPLWPDTDDDIYIYCFEQLVPPLLEAFQPDVVITQLGVDTFLADPLANLNLTTRGFGHCLRLLREIIRGGWIALGGGGYDVINVARGWTLAWAIMLGREKALPERLPEEFCQRHNLPSDRCRLLDPSGEKLRGRFWARAKRDAQDVVNFVRSRVFPLVGARAS